MIRSRINANLKRVIWIMCLFASWPIMLSLEGNNPVLAAQQLKATDAEAQTALDPQIKQVLEKMAVAGVLHPRTVEQVRQSYLFYPTLSGKPENVFRVENRSIAGPAGNVPIRMYYPHPGRDLPIVVFFHGGAFVAGSLDTHDAVLRSITNLCDCIVISVGYRLAPENPYPAAPDDAYAATKWVFEHAPEFGGDPHRLAVAGDGAGGNLAAVVTLMARDRHGPSLMYQVLIYPSLDSIMEASRYTSNDPVLTPDARAAILAAYVPFTHDLEDPYVSPIYAKSFKNLPQGLIVTDEDDPTRDEGNSYATRLLDDGVPVKVSAYPNMIHGFLLMAGELDGAKKAIGEISEALRSAFGSAAPPVPSQN